MEFIRIFGKNLFAVKYPKEDYDELVRVFKQWQDMEFLDDFFEKNKKDLSYFNLPVEEAIENTYDEANLFRKKLLNKAQNNPNELNSLFQNLSLSDPDYFELIKQKSRWKWLRIYAIRIDECTYLITGGAIKLTQKMSDRDHTKKELDKIEQCRNYLKENDVFDYDSFKEMLNEWL